MRRSIWVQRDISHLLLGFCRRNHVSVNRVVNLAVSDFLGKCSVEEVRLKARLARLMHEEKELRKTCNVMLRSGSYLPSYVQRVLKEPGRPLDHLPVAQTPLKALNPKEERVFRKIAARREEIAQEIADIQLQLLQGVKPFRLKPDVGKRMRRIPPLGPDFTSAQRKFLNRHQRQEWSSQFSAENKCKSKDGGEEF